MPDPWHLASDRPRALDLFCGAGGAGMGLHRAGFDVLGVDIRRQKRYPFGFVQADATRPPLRLEDFDLIWASPPCQRHTRMWRGREQMRERYPELIGPIRALLAGHPRTVIENVVGAPIRPDLLLTGAQFDLDLVRDRVFEVSGFNVPFELVRPHGKTVSGGGLACVVGNGANNAYSARNTLGRRVTWRETPVEIRERLLARNNLRGWSEAMGIDWMTRNELREAIPPAYSEFIGRAALASMGRERAA